jgi:hypothetical protein
MGKVKGGSNGCGNFRRFQLSKQDAVCKMVQSMKEYMFIVEPFYQTSSFV